MKRFIFIVVAFCFFVACAEKPLPPKPFPIMLGLGPLPAVISQSNFDFFAQSGFNYVLVESTHPERNQRMLTFADSAQINVFIQDPYINSLASQDSFDFQKIDSVFRNYTIHPAFTGFYLNVKPHVKDLGKIKKVYAACRQVAPDHPTFIHLYGAHDLPIDYGAQDIHRYYSSVLDSLELDLICADNYGVEQNKLIDGFFETLVALRNIVKREHKQFLGYALTLDFYNHPVPRHSDLRAQFYGALAFGAKGILYSHFYPPDETREYDYGYAMTDHDGNLTNVYRNAVEINKDISVIGQIVQDLQFQYVYHTIPSPLEELRLPPGLLVEKMQGKFLAGFFKNDADQHYLLFANMDVDHGDYSEIIFANRVKRVFKIDKKTGREEALPWFKDNAVKILFQAGDAELLRLELTSGEE